MNKLSVKIVIASLVLMMGLTGISYAAGRKSAKAPPDGTYHSARRGDIVFNAANGSWEAVNQGSRGSFEFNTETAKIMLTLTQRLDGFRWTNVEPVQGYADGRVEKDAVVIGDFQFNHESLWRHED